MKKRAMTDEAKAKKSALILDKAAEMFLRSDYASVKIADLSRELDMSTGVIFKYFKSKENIFASLLFREVVKRLDELCLKIDDSSIRGYEDFKAFILDDFRDIADKNSLYLRLESIRSIFLEKNPDMEVAIKHKKIVREKLHHAVSKLARSGVFTEREIVDIHFAELLILLGSMHATALPAELSDRLKKAGCEDYIRNFREDAFRTIENYLDGLWRNRNRVDN